MQGKLGKSRRMFCEQLEVRAMLTGEGNSPPQISPYIWSDDPSNAVLEGSNLSLTDQIPDWTLNVDVQDNEGGFFDLKFDLDNDGNFGETGEPTIDNFEVTGGPSVSTWTITVPWSDIVALGIADTHPFTQSHEIHVRAYDHGSTDVLNDDQTTMDVRDSMPFFGTVSAVQAGGGGGGGCSGSAGPVTVSGNFTEYGVGDSVTVQINWGDGNIETLPATAVSNQTGVSFSKDHNYANTSDTSYHITWKVWDDENGDFATDPDYGSEGSQDLLVTAGGAGGGPSVCLDGSGVLTVTGSTGNDTVTISQPTSGQIHVESSFFPTSDFPAASVQNMVVLLGDGNDVLLSTANKPIVAVGGAGNDILIGGPAPSILIGGSGSDLLYGGSSQDVLVDGATANDGNAAALLALLAEWDSGHTFQDRVRNMTNGSGNVAGLNGSFFIAPAGNDGAIDILIGGSGTDWIIRHAGDLNLGLFDFVQ